ncbi:hypothetical protein MPSEU_000997400 [Mayamaea pseudoterrestris]|nr:hypothetical protein MPSEU_000997400 [Mayamaea pseudoterrestris]
MEWRIYNPSLFPVTIQPGDMAYFRPASAEPGVRGKCLPVNNDDESHATNSEYVTLEVETTATSNSNAATKKRVKRKRLLPVYQSPTLQSSNSNNNNKTLILVTPQTMHYRHLAASQTYASDGVLEIGCSTGMTSQIIWRMRPVSWVGFDTGLEMVQTTRQKLQQQHSSTTTSSNKNYTCIQIDALKESSRAKREATRHGPVSLVLMDIGGNRDLRSVIDMLQWVLASLNPDKSLRMVIIKSEELTDALCGEANDDGVVPHGADWFIQQLQESVQTLQRKRELLPSHPLQAPMRQSPLDASVMICRYHNYHASGCFKGVDCPHDHAHCHWCGAPGHVATTCPQLV